MNYAIILSGGIGSRMRADGFPKQYMEVNQKPIIVYTLEQFASCNAVDQVVIVANPVWQEKILAWMEQYKIKNKFAAFVKPGTSRQGSILNGLEQCVKLSTYLDADRVIIHDAVRPLVTSELILKCFAALEGYDGCMPVLPVTDTIYYSEDGRTIKSLLERNMLFAGQSPEAFRLRPYYEINVRASDDEIYNTRGTTEIAYKYGLKVCLIQGEHENFKLTTPVDMDRFKTVLAKRSEGR